MKQKKLVCLRSPALGDELGELGELVDERGEFVSIRVSWKMSEVSWVTNLGEVGAHGQDRALRFVQR